MLPMVSNGTKATVYVTTVGDVTSSHSPKWLAYVTYKPSSGLLSQGSGYSRNAVARPSRD